MNDDFIHTSEWFIKLRERLGDDNMRYPPIKELLLLSIISSDVLTSGQSFAELMGENE